MVCKKWNDSILEDLAIEDIYIVVVILNIDLIKIMLEIYWEVEGRLRILCDEVAVTVQEN
jgi:hypothetical protein